MKRIFIFAAALFLASSGLEAGYTLHKGKLVDSQCVPMTSADAHYQGGCDALSAENWKDAAYNFNIISLNFPNHPCFYESKYYLGIAYFNQGEYEFANEAFTDYLNCQNNPRYFEDAIAYKLQIANCFRCGARKRIFGSKMLPQWASGRSLAIEIYNEVITALPCHEFSAEALYAKAYIHWENQDFKESVDAFQTLIRRFPKHELAPAAYLCIGSVYLEQAQTEFQNPDILALAQINAKKFQRDFPKDESLSEAEEMVQAIKEFYCRGLWETGQFYERIEKPAASAIYYASAIRQFPDTSFADCCRYRLSVVAETCEEVELCEFSAS